MVSRSGESTDHDRSRQRARVTVLCRTPYSEDMSPNPQRKYPTIKIFRPLTTETSSISIQSFTRDFQLYNISRLPGGRASCIESAYEIRRSVLRIACGVPSYHRTYIQDDRNYHVHTLHAPAFNRIIESPHARVPNNPLHVSPLFLSKS